MSRSSTFNRLGSIATFCNAPLAVIVTLTSSAAGFAFDQRMFEFGLNFDHFGLHGLRLLHHSHEIQHCASPSLILGLKPIVIIDFWRRASA